MLGLDRLVQPVGPLPAVHRPAGVLVDDDDRQLVVLARVAVDHVVAVALVEVVRLQRVVDQVRPLHVAGGVEALDAGELLRLADARVGQVAGPLLLLDLEVHALRRRVLRVDLGSGRAASSVGRPSPSVPLDVTVARRAQLLRALRSSSVSCRATLSASSNRCASENAGPLMISGVRASSIRMLSTSSMIA